MMTRRTWIKMLVYALIFLLAIMAMLVWMAQHIPYAHAQGECVHIAHIGDIHEYQMSYTDDQGRDICKLILHLHRDNPGDPQEHIVFNGSGEKQGYAAEFAGAHVSAHRTTNPLYISNADVYAIEAVPTETAPPPTPTNTPTFVPPVPTDTSSATPTGDSPPYPPPATVTQQPPYPPPGDTATPTQPGILTPPVTRPPGTDIPPTSKPPDKVRTPDKELPATGSEDLTGGNLPLWFGAAFLLIVVIFFARRMRG